MYINASHICISIPTCVLGANRGLKKALIQL